MSPRKIQIVLNPASGCQLSQSLVDLHIKPLLVSCSRSSVEVVIRRTEGEGDGVRIGREIRQEWMSFGVERGMVDIVLVGGDGTTHELLNGLYLALPQSTGTNEMEEEDGEEKGKVVVRLALVPGGTANALYSALYPKLWTQEVQQSVATTKSIQDVSDSVIQVMLKSVSSLATSLSSTVQSSAQEERLCVLPLMLNTLTNKEENKQLLSHLVTSHALHAAILYDADTPTMRRQYAGIERFKIAAEQNATKWVDGILTLLPAGNSNQGEGVLRYSPSSKSFQRFTGARVELEGPLLYLNAMVTDRLESRFIPAPLSSAFREDDDEDGLIEGVVDVIVIRPMRDPQLSKDEEAGVKFATTRLDEITTGMYSGGTHVNLTYGQKNDDDAVMVEYFRCSGYDFVASIKKKGNGEEDKERLVCTDGYISFADRVRVRRWTTGDDGDGKVVPPLIWR